VKELYELIQNDSAIRSKIKLIGIGAGNNAKEVRRFKNITEAPFPLFPDQDFSIHEALGEVRTPYFIGIKIGEDGTHEVIYSELGGFREAGAFLDLILSSSGLR
jgi:hypothetical protein